ncbi:MAG: hypothetical protein GY869_06950, partial [Planctomycetes bacterium]|nr:hypothetical protein [Planctomycetota bacterium]
MKKFLVAISFLMGLSYLTGALAGDTDSSVAPSNGSGMVTINELYNYLHSGSLPMVLDNFQMPMTAPGSSMNSIQDIFDSTKAKFDQCNAAPDQVLNGVKYFSTDPARWGPTYGTAVVSTGNASAGDVLSGKIFSNANSIGVSGTMVNNGAMTITPGSEDQAITAGYHNGSG